MGRFLTRFIFVCSLLTLLCEQGGVALADEAATQTKRVEVGQQAPDFELPALDGSSRSLESLRGKRSLVLIFFRGAW